MDYYPDACITFVLANMNEKQYGKNMEMVW